jgi:hypothetical protein
MPQLALWVSWVAQINTIRAATEAACLVLSVDKTIKNPRVKNKWVFLALNLNIIATILLLSIEVSVTVSVWWVLHM